MPFLVGCFFPKVYGKDDWNSTSMENTCSRFLIFPGLTRGLTWGDQVSVTWGDQVIGTWGDQVNVYKYLAILIRDF